MKYALAALSMIALPANAQGSSSVQDTANTAQGRQLEACNVLAQGAERLMTARQNGEDLATIMETLNKNRNTRDPIANQLASIILDYAVEAFDEPRWPVEELRANAILDFKNAKYLECYRTIVDDE